MRPFAFDASISDFDTFFELCYGSRDLPVDLRKNVKHEWTHILNYGNPIGLLVKDLSAGADSVISAAFGIFLASTTITAFLERDQPFLNFWLVEAFEKGENRFLSPADLALLQAETGVELYIPYLSWAHESPTCTASQLALLRAFTLQAFAKRVVGHRIDRIIMEVIGSKATSGIRAYGYEVLSAYPDWVDPHPEWDMRPCLVGLTLDDAIRTENYFALTFFGWQQPVFCFEENLQKLLEGALAGKTNPEIATSLSYSENTIRLWWKQIYARVEEIMPDLLPRRSTDKEHKHLRGGERRRILLRYLQDHPEELKPVLPLN